MDKTDSEAITPETSRTPENGDSDDSGIQVSGPILHTRKSFLDLLTEDLSWQTARDVLAYDVNRPLTDRSTIDLIDVALEDGLINKDQHRELRREENLAQESLGRIMLERGMITDEQIHHIVSKSKSLERAVAELVDAGNRAGGTDNITTLLLQCVS